MHGWVCKEDSPSHRLSCQWTAEIDITDQSSCHHKSKRKEDKVRDTREYSSLHKQKSKFLNLIGTCVSRQASLIVFFLIFTFFTDQ